MRPQDEAKRLNSPPLQGRGRGWGLSANAIASLHGNAAAMRRDPTEPEKRLWSRPSHSQLGGFKFRRQATIGAHIVDFLCPAARLIVEVDGDTHADPAADARRDAALSARGYTVVRFTNADVMRNIDGVLERLLTLLQSSPLPFRGGPGVGPLSEQPPRARRRPTPTPPLKRRGLRRSRHRSCCGRSAEGRLKMLVVGNLSAGTAGKAILNALSLTINAGEVHAITGWGVAGKATLATREPR